MKAAVITDIGVAPRTEVVSDPSGSGDGKVLIRAGARIPDMLASYERGAALALPGSLSLPTRTFPLDEAQHAWTAQASSPGAKIVVAGGA